MIKTLASAPFIADKAGRTTLCCSGKISWLLGQGNGGGDENDKDNDNDDAVPVKTLTIRTTATDGSE